MMLNYNNELYHYGVKGMKWGVRRTPEQLGYSSNRDSRRLAKSLSEANQTAKNYMNSRKTSYIEGGAGNRIFIHDTKKLKSMKKYESRTDSLISKLKKKYDSVEAVANIDKKTGKQYVTAILKKNENIYFTELIDKSK